MNAVGSLTTSLGGKYSQYRDIFISNDRFVDFRNITQLKFGVDRSFNSHRVVQQSWADSF